MIKTLLSLRLRSSLSAMTGKKKDGSYKASVGKIVLISILFAYLLLVFGAMFTFMAIGMAIAMIPLGLDWLYFAMFMLIAFAFIFIFSIFETKSQLFECKDNELLLSMPIKPGDIVISRIFTVLIYNYCEEAIIMLPCIIVYATLGGSITGIIGSILVSLLLPLLATALSSGVGYLVALITKRVKKNSFITVAVSLVFLFLYIWGYTAFMGSIGAEEGSEPDFAALGESLSGLRVVGLAATLHPLWTTAFAVISIAAAYIAYKLISASYISIVNDKGGAKRAEYKARKLKSASAFSAIARKELRKFASSSTYMLNGAMGIIFTILLAVIVLINKDMITELTLVLSSELPWIGGEAIGVVMAAALVMCCAMTFISSAALSLEGKNLWIIRSMPVSARTVLFAKTVPHIIITTPPTLVASVIMIAATSPSPFSAVLMILSPIAANVMSAFFGMVMNVAFPKFEYENEAQPIKQSLCTFLVSLILMLYGLLTVGISVLFSFFGLPLIGGTVSLLFSVALSVIFAFILAYPSAKRYETFNA